MHVDLCLSSTLGFSEHHHPKKLQSPHQEEDPLRLPLPKVIGDRRGKWGKKKRFNAY